MAVTLLILAVCVMDVVVLGWFFWRRNQTTEAQDRRVDPDAPVDQAGHPVRTSIDHDPANRFFTDSI